MVGWWWLAYQAAFVSAYNTKEAAQLPPSKDFNKAGRAYPDVAGISHNYLVIVDSTLGG